MLSPRTGLSAAMLALEEYYAGCSGAASERWRMARYPTPRGAAGTSSSSSSSSSFDRSGSFGPANAIPDGMGEDRASAAAEATAPSHPPPESMIRGMLPRLRAASDKAETRASERERALSEVRDRVSESESILMTQKEWARSQWRRVADEESNIDRLYAVKKMEQHEFYENLQRRRQEAAALDRAAAIRNDGGGEEEPLSREVWEMVSHVATSMEDFTHTGYSPRAAAQRKSYAEDVGGQRFDDACHAVDPEDRPHHHHHRHQQQQQQQQQQQLRQSSEIPPRKITRADVESESDIRDIRMVAMAADESVEDAAGKLLNTMSKGDTTYRSARLAAESCLLSECNGARDILRSLVAMERASLEDKTRRLVVLEAAVNAIDVRRDIDDYIAADKAAPGGRSIAGEDDDGGIAAALAVLNSHCEGRNSNDSPMKFGRIERPCYFEGWGEDGACDDDAADDDDDVQPELFGDVISILFEDVPLGDGVDEEGPESREAPVGGSGRAPGSRTVGSRDLLNEEKLSIACNALAEKSKGESFRKSVLYELNNQRSVRTEVQGRANFDALCRVFNSFLSGCGRESSDVSNTKMLMILSQTFYMVDQAGNDGGNDAKECDKGSTIKDRQSRIYVKNNICHHNIWSDDDFWDQALYQCVSESLSKSGVLLNYVNSSTDHGIKFRGDDAKEVKWHDLPPSEYAGAASQVHSVVFAQLGTLSRECGALQTSLDSCAFIQISRPLSAIGTDSMLELGCGIPRACNFVRRLSIRYQLPLSLRITLIQHLTKKRS